MCLYLVCGKFSDKFKTDGIVLEKDSTIARCFGEYGAGFHHRYVLSSEKPVKNGIHCWRIVYEKEESSTWVCDPSFQNP